MLFGATTGRPVRRRQKQPRRARLAGSRSKRFAISEFADWLLFTFTKYRLSTRILISSLAAVPLDTTVFLYGAALARNMEFGEPMGDTFNIANWIVFVIGKMVGAVVVSAMIRMREKRGEVDPQAA